MDAAADAEAEAAYDWYATVNPQAARRFRERLREAIVSISEDAEGQPRYEGEVRRYLLPKYPYGVLYEVIDDTVFVVAVMHLKRRPLYWKK